MSSTATTERAAPKIATPKPALSVFDAVMIVTGIVIGAGIYSAPPAVAGFTGSVELMLFAWILGGVLSLIGALNYAELATTFPNAGGDYHFLTRAYGKDVSFFFAWARVTVITTGSIALLGFVFGDYMTKLLPLGPYSSAIYAALTVVVLTLINIVGLRESARTQNVLTLLEVGGLLLVVLAGVMVGSSAPAASTAAPAAAGTFVPAMFGLAMVFVLLTYGGWNEAAYISAEVKGGKRAILKALVLALLLITVAYVVVVLALLYGLGFQGIKDSKAVAADVMTKAFGPFGTTLVGASVAVATLTSINATMLVGARTNYALGNDWPILAFMSRWHGERDAPVRAFIAQAVVALGLIALGAVETNGFKTMVEFTAPVFWFFFLLTGVSVIVLRFKYPHVARPFKVPLYPILPLAFIATCGYLLYSSINYAQSQRAVHVAFYVMLVGLVAWIIARLKRGT